VRKPATEAIPTPRAQRNSNVMAGKKLTAYFPTQSEPADSEVSEESLEQQPGR